MPELLSPGLLSEVARTYGTPVYIYHAERIKEQYQLLQDAFAGTGARFFYACKALTNINILRYIRSLGCHIDCSSVNEVHLALKAGFEPAHILYTSNSIAFSEIEEAASFGININIDSLGNLAKFGEKFGNRYPVGIRLRPNIMAGGNLKISTGHERSKFGIPIEYIGEVLELSAKTGLRIRGLQIHTGSEIRDVEIFARGIEVLFSLAPKFPGLEFIDLGGGFKVPYRPDETGTDVFALGRKIKEEFDAFEKQYGRKLQPWFEPGKFLVSQAGYLVASVTVLKPSQVTVFAGVDTGLNHLIRPMMYGSYHEIRNISHPGGPVEMYTVVGNICETDTFAEDRPLNQVREGDFLAFYNAGAYGFEMASNYNSRYRPPEVLILNNRPHLIRKRETMESLLEEQVEIDVQMC